MREIVRLVVVLTLICVVTAGALEILRVQLEPRIEMQEDLNVRGPALASLFGKPADELLANKVVFHHNDADYPIFYLKENGEVTSLAIEAAGKGGYGGDVSIMIGIDLKQNRTLGMEIIKHAETPGVGSRIEKESFRKQWQKLPSTEDVALGKQIAAISGATYSSRAAINASNQIIAQVRDSKDEILALIQKKENG
ncbi:FMN-binding protein [bacterium]|nr:MAG: FMN-binding protein [bacterium]